MAYQMRLPELLADLGLPGPPPAVSITGMTLDSRAVEPGDLFVAQAGSVGHGLEFAKQALARGCAAIVYEPAANLPKIPSTPTPVIAVDRLGQRSSELADRFYRQPSAKVQVIGITGTNGKSSCVEFLASALHGSGQPSGTLGTLGSGLLGNRQQASNLTTPDALTFQRELARMRDAGAHYVVAEVSSHALDQGRVAAVRFCGALFTNLSRDHLDYHGTMASYAASKARLFADFALKFAIFNADDDYSELLRRGLTAQTPTLSFGFEQGEVRATEIEYTQSGATFQLQAKGQSVAVSSTLLGQFNIANQLAVAAALCALGWPPEDIAKSLGQLRPPEGRMQVLGGGEQALVIIDYAHTPAALASALTAVRQHIPGRLICVFGCGGDRDRGKRPLMGAVAERLADAVVLTDDNPRSEDSAAIVRDILQGMAQPDSVQIERDRAHAIAGAITAACRGDSVLIAGKGHEAYQERQGQRSPFSDHQVAAQVLEAAA